MWMLCWRRTRRQASQQLRRLKAQLLFQLSRWEPPASTMHDRPVQSRPVQLFTFNHKAHQSHLFRRQQHQKT